MTNDNSDFSEMQTSLLSDAQIQSKMSLWQSQREELAALISPSTDYKRLAWNVLTGVGTRGMNEKFMLDKESFVGQRILQWIDDHAQFDYYRDYIKQVPYRDFLDLETTETLLFNLWRATDASLWLSTRDAASYRDFLWVMSVMRLSAFLNTGDWEFAIVRASKLLNA
jgi:hypothetical protein